MVTRERVGRAWSYRPAASREAYIAQLMLDALDLAGSRDAALVRFARSVTGEEAEILRAALRRAGARRAGPRAATAGTADTRGEGPRGAARSLRRTSPGSCWPARRSCGCCCGHGGPGGPPVRHPHLAGGGARLGAVRRRHPAGARPGAVRPGRAGRRCPRSRRMLARGHLPAPGRLAAICLGLLLGVLFVATHVTSLAQAIRTRRRHRACCALSRAATRPRRTCSCSTIPPPRRTACPACARRWW